MSVVCREVSDQLQTHLQQAQGWYKEYADKKRLDAKGFNVGDEVLISTKNVRTQRPSKKLEMVWMGLYRVRRKVSEVNYEIALPKNVKIHPVFHVKLLKPYTRSTKPGAENAKPPPIRVDPDEDYVIKEILDVRRRGRGFEYLVDWEGYTEGERTWEPRRSLADDAMLKRWHANHPEKSSPF
ncbi:hypothetical protein SeMB42_g02818 [Synchytrium endobioticum]|uniref:Chromo domain-containing protein n=1 Tax=Synchytrium endobioticum TaxID=286115 RepID=A0A507DBX2_9FUNG|nr:hypothetical protein SeMB42_g02818 [Synchytrium endobioticum]